MRPVPQTTIPSSIPEYSPMMITPVDFCFQVEGDAHHAVVELDQFLRTDTGQAGGAGNPVAGLEHRADFPQADFRLVILDLSVEVGCEVR